MTNILEEIKKHKEKLKLYTNIDEATKRFESQKTAIRKIVGTEGYNAIKDFWIIQSMSALEELKTVKFEDPQTFGKIQERLDISEKFLKFLDSRE